MYEALAGIGYRKGDGTDFVPKTMIENLFDYGEFLRVPAGEPTISKFKTSLSGQRILVIGAGIAGLVARYELAKAGAIVDIVDQNPITTTKPSSGKLQYGRMNSIYNGSNVFEMGCMRFPPSSTALFHYFKECGITTQKNFPDPGVYGTYAQLYYQNQRIEWPGSDKEGQTSPPKSELFQRIGYNFGNILTYLLGPSGVSSLKPGTLNYAWYQYEQGKGTRQAVVDIWQKLLDTYKDLSFEQGIFTLAQDPAVIAPDKSTSDPSAQPWSASDMNAFGALGVGSGGFGPLFQIGFTDILRLIANGFEVGQQLVPAGIATLGLSLLKKGSDAQSGKDFKIFSGLSVRNLGPNTTLEKNGDFSFALGMFNFSLKTPEKNYVYDGVVVTLSHRAAQAAGFTLGQIDRQPEKETNAIKNDIRNLHMTTSSKFFVLADKPFWKGKVDYPTNIQTDENLRALYCLDYENGAGKGVILVSYVWEDDSTKLEAMPPQERFDTFIATLKKINSTFAADLLANSTSSGTLKVHELIDWQKEVGFYGAFKLNSPGQDEMCSQGYFQPFLVSTPGYPTRLIFCGDSFSWVGGWMEGPITSALNACSALVKLLKPTDVRFNSPINTIPMPGEPGAYNYSKKFKVTQTEVK